MQIRFSLSVKSINIIFRVSFQNRDWKNHEKLSFYFLFFVPFFLLFHPHSIYLISITLLHSHYYSHSIFHSSFLHHSIPILFSILLSIFKLFILHRFFYYRSKNLVPRKSHGIPMNYGEVRKTLKVSER